MSTVSGVTAADDTSTAGDTARDDEASGSSSAAGGPSNDAMTEDEAARVGAFRAVGGDGAALPSYVRGPKVAPGYIQWGGLISPASSRRIACCAGIQRVILGPAGAVLDVGREYRTATPAQFAALIARDGGCAFPGCARPASWCVAHHIIHWVDGGPTNMDNLVLLFTHHHTVIHHHGWDIEMGADRLPTFYPPPWVDPHREPRRNNRPRIGLPTLVPRQMNTRPPEAAQSSAASLACQRPPMSSHAALTPAGDSGREHAVS